MDYKSITYRGFKLILKIKIKAYTLFTKEIVGFLLKNIK